MAQGIGLQSAINQTLGTIQTGVVQNIAIKQLREQTAASKEYAKALDKVQSGEDVDIETVPKQYQAEVKKHQEEQEAIDKATAETALNTAQRLMGGNDPLAAFRIKNLKQRQEEEKTRHISRERMLDNLYGKKQSETT